MLLCSLCSMQSSIQNRAACVRIIARMLPILLCPALTGCGGGTPTTLGASPAGVIVPVSATVQARAAQTITLRGEMIERCPVAGCWFKLRDKSGVVHVDTKAAGFVVTDVPLHTQMTVQGTTIPGAGAQITATGLRY